MSDPMTTVQRLEGPEMVSLRGDLLDPAFGKDVQSALGIKMPDVRKIVRGDAKAVAWMAPDELLIFVEDAAAIVDVLQRALNGQHHLVLDVSDQRVIFDLQGDGWRDILAKGAPIDLHADAFGPGDFRRTRLGQVAAAIWCLDVDHAQIAVMRSVSDFVQDWFDVAVQPGRANQVF